MVWRYSGQVLLQNVTLIRLTLDIIRFKNGFGGRTLNGRTTGDGRQRDDSCSTVQ